MNNTKSLLGSVTFWGAFTAALPVIWSVIVAVFPKLRVISSDDVSSLAGNVVTVVGAIVALIGRFRANSNIVSVLPKSGN